MGALATETRSIRRDAPLTGKSLPKRPGSGTAYGPDGIVTTWEWVTWEKAAEYLGHNIGNRNVRKRNKARLDNEMVNETFMPTHQGIAFDWDGVLRDGQNRLLAMVDTKSDLWMMVSRGLDPASQRHMDRPAVRQVSDFMDRSYPTARTAAARVIVAVRALDGVITPNGISAQMELISDSELYRMFDSDDEIHLLMDKYVKPAGRAARMLPVGHSPVLAASVIFPDVADNFLEAIATGVGFNEGNPLLAFRNSSLSSTHKGNRHALRQQHQATYHTLRVFSMAHRQVSARKLYFDAQSEITIPIP